MENVSEATQNIFRDLGKWFWKESIWLPPNITWKDVANGDNAGDAAAKVLYAQFDDLYYAFPVAVALLCLRFSLERFVFTPIGCYYGLRRTAKGTKAVSNPVLENAFRSNGQIGYKHIQGLAKKCEWTERKVERWLRQRYRQEKPSTLNKFTESAWRFSFYSSAFVYGLYILYDKPWFWETKFCWYDYPHHSVTKGVWWYYLVQLGFYWSLAFTQFVDIKRKDFLQMFIHHIVAILLLSLSWVCNLTRIGTFVLVVHDFADVPLEAAKMAKYIKKQRVADVLFVVFTLSWIVSRLGLYPYRVIYSTLFESLALVPVFPAYFIFNGLLCGLQVLHIIWTWAIVQIAIQAISTKSGIQDIRSSGESNSDGEGRDEVPVAVKDKKLS